MSSQTRKTFIHVKNTNQDSFEEICETAIQCKQAEAVCFEHNGNKPQHNGNKPQHNRNKQQHNRNKLQQIN